MDQATPTHQGILWHQRKRGQNTNLDLSHRWGNESSNAIEAAKS